MFGKIVYTPIAVVITIIAAGCHGAATTSPQFLPTPHPSPQFTCSALVGVNDPMRLIASCDAQFNPTTYTTDGVWVTENAVTVHWTGAMCQPIFTANITSAADVIDVALTGESPPYIPGTPSCAGGVGPSVLMALHFAAPIDTSVHASFNGADLPIFPPTPSTSADPTVLPSTSPASTAIPHAIECAPPPVPPGETPPAQQLPTVIDEIGIVDSCLQTDALVGLQGQHISVSNPFDDIGLEIVWDPEACPFLNSVTLRFTGAGHELVGHCGIDGATSSLPLYVTLSEPLPAAFIHAYLEAEAGASPIPTPTLPPPVTPSTTPDAASNARDRIDRFWESFGDVGCVGLGAPDSIDTVVGWADVIVIARPTGAQTWNDAPYPAPNSLVTLEVSEVVKGHPDFQEGDVLQLYGSDLPAANVSDIDHLLFLNVLKRDPRVYYLTDNFLTVFANVDGRVITPEYAALKKVEGSDLYSIRLDGTKFDDLVDRIRTTDRQSAGSGGGLTTRAYFAC